MKKWTLFLATMILTSQSLANPQGLSPRTESANTCGMECMNGRSSNDALKRFVMEMSAITDGALDIEVISEKMNYANKCDQFAADGDMKKWGNVIIKELENDKYANMLNNGPRDIGEYCPNFRKMETEERKALNVLIMTAMAHYESSCNFREKAPGPNGTAAGLLQLHKGKEQNYSSGCRKNDSATAERTLVCGLSMLNDQIERGEKLFSASSYWEVLRPRGRSQKAKKIMAAIRKFPACGTPQAISTARRNKDTRIAQN